VAYNAMEGRGLFCLRCVAELERHQSDREPRPPYRRFHDGDIGHGRG
jgi:hypothetical protein